MARRHQYHRQKKSNGTLIAMFIGSLIGFLIILGGNV
jgi:hypothetical protein